MREEFCLHSPLHTHRHRGRQHERAWARHTALQGLRGCLPSPLCWSSRAVQSVGGFILKLLLLFHINETCAVTKQLSSLTCRAAAFTGKSLSFINDSCLNSSWDRFGANEEREAFTWIHWKGNAKRLKWVSWNAGLLLVPTWESKQHANSLLQGGREGGTELQMRLKGEVWVRYFILCMRPRTRGDS